MSGRRSLRGRPPAWWSPLRPQRDALLSLAATPELLPARAAGELARGVPPAQLLCPGSPDPAGVAADLERLGIRFLVPGDEGWPDRLAAADPPPAWLFMIGPAPPERAVAVVGGRRASPLRLAVARALAAGLARAGFCVVSGGAVGVDAAAHEGALDAGGRTAVVLGCGLDVPYPRANVGLLKRVRQAGGTLLTEHAPGARPRAAHFLPRNRLIAALAEAVVVVEARAVSGSLATARAAGSLGGGRVLAVPGAPWDPGAEGCNALIRDGAVLVRSLDDVLEALGWPGTPPGGALPRRPWPPGAPARQVLAALLDGHPASADRLAEATGLAPPDLAAALLELELAGFVRRFAGGVELLALPAGERPG